MKAIARALLVIMAGLAIVVIAVLMGGCEYVTVNTSEPGQEVTTSQITWIKTPQDQVSKTCANEASMGCALVGPVVNKENRCTVVMDARADDTIVAHEMRHCFGWAHTKEINQ